MSTAPAIEAPKLRRRTMLRLLPQAFRDPLGALLRLSQQHGPLYRMVVHGQTFFFVNHPDLVREVLKTRADRYFREDDLGYILPRLGTGLASAKGDEWTHQRRMLVPAFQKPHDDALEAVIQEEVAAAIARWQARLDQAPAFDVAILPEVKRIALRIIVRALLSPDAPLDTEAVIEALGQLSSQAQIEKVWVRGPLDALRGRFGLPPIVTRTVHRSFDLLDAYAYATIRGCRDGRYQPGHLLAILLDAEREGLHDETRSRDQLVTFLLAGVDTVALALAWALASTARHPEAAGPLRTEAAQVLGNRLPTIADAAHLTYTQQFVYETLRLYPPVFSEQRIACEAHTLGGYHVPKGAALFLCGYALHRHPGFWDNPEVFDPRRFEREGHLDAFVGYQYTPFGHGRHACIGRRVAMLEATMVVAALAHRFDFALVDPAPPKLYAAVGIRARPMQRLRIAARPLPPASETASSAAACPVAHR